jgi:cellulose synthase/poly-beta-1,6-N-acetylglucosamine synthase-like glycosyltransferase
VTGVLFAALAACCLLPVSEDGTEDRGDGRALVRIPRHVKTSPHHQRTFVFLGVMAGLGLLFLGWQRPSPSHEYARVVQALATGITRDPVSVDGYIARLRPATEFFGVAYILGIATVARASAARRLVMASHAILFVAMSVLLQALMISGGIVTSWPIAPFGIESTLANLLIGGLVVQRLTFSSYVLPRATRVAIRRRRWIWDSALAFGALAAVVAALVVGFAFLSQPIQADSAWQVFVPLYAGSILFALLAAPLWLLWWTHRRLPVAGDDRPPVDVIIPAFNEAENIARCLRSIDVAAGCYGGPVLVLVSNDGSRDSTVRLAEQEFARFEHATGRILTAPNGGQARALNRGLAITDAPIVVRIDADCVMGADALAYVVPWFRDPEIGCVGAMEEPRTDTVTWFHRLRTLETLFQFRFLRLGQSLVDGIVVIPGTFTAFRRAPVSEVGGIVMGMNGEDSDITMQIGRVGYRVVVDPRVRCYEDVPRSVGEFLEQRTRCARAGFHVYARHVPLRSGLAGPRVWFWTVRRGFSWFSLQAGLVAPIFMFELVLTNPTYRQNLSTLVLLWAAGGAIPLVISLPLAIKYRHWQSIGWIPTWFAYAFLRRLATLEAAISLPTRAVPVPAWEPAPQLLSLDSADAER